MAYLEGEAVFFKKVRTSLKYGLHLDAVISRWAREHANEVGALDVTKNKYEQLLKYGLHLDAVISRWAREHANEVGALDVTKNNYEQLLKYGLHLDAVTSRWAREHANEVGALDVTKIAIYTRKITLSGDFSLSDGTECLWAMGRSQSVLWDGVPPIANNQ